MHSKSPLNFNDPWEAFEEWYTLAQKPLLNRNKNAVILATSSAQNQPTCRVVLLKDYSAKQGFVFYTNYNSAKGQAIEHNPRAALLFFWDALGRQIRIEGRVQKLPAATSDAYFQSRPRDSQISACVSQQSMPIENYQILQAQCETMEQAFAGQEIKRPEHWGGYALQPTHFEFWQDKRSRRHERLCFERVPSAGQSNWQKSYLAP